MTGGCLRSMSGQDGPGTARLPARPLVLYDRELVNSRPRTMEGNARGHTKGVLLDSLSPLRSS